MLTSSARITSHFSRQSVAIETTPTMTASNASDCKSGSALDRPNQPGQVASSIFPQIDRSLTGNMSLIRLLHALSTGAATFGLNPTLPPVRVMPKSPAEAFTEDALKLKGDFEIARIKIAEEVDSRGRGVAAET